MKLPKELTTVTPISKWLALILFITLPFVGFRLGMQYQQLSYNSDLADETIKTSTNSVSIVQPSNMPIPNETTVWKTFTSEKLGITFQVPPEFTLSKSEWPDPQGVPNTYYLGTNSTNDGQIKDGCITFPFRGNDLDLSIKVLLNDTRSIDEFIAQNSNVSLEERNKKTITLANADKTVTWQWLGEYVYPISGGNQAKSCPKQRGEGEVLIMGYKNTRVIIYKSPLSATKQRQDEYNKILSTFKFTN